MRDLAFVEKIKDRLSIIDDELLIPKADAGVLEVASIAIKEALQECYSVLNKGKYREEEYELFIRLVDLYKRQANTTDKLDYYPKAIGICHYILKLLVEKNDITCKEEKRELVFELLHNIEADFFQKLKKVLPKNLGIARISEHKDRLKNYREGIKKYLEELTDLGLPVCSEKIDETGIRERAKKVEEIYLDIREFFIGKKGKGGLFNELFLQCINDLGGLPKVDDRDVGYAVYGLGSMALGTMTPWSDVEFGILIEGRLEEKKKEEVKQFFCEVTTLLYMRVTNFGETLIKALGIEELNNLKSGKKEDSWFYDELTKSGFSFDGVVREACKTPLGRKGYLNEKGEPVPDFDLITTPREFAGFQEDERFAHDDHLLQALNYVLYVQGSEELIESYLKNIAVRESLIIKGLKNPRLLLEDYNKYRPKIIDQAHEGKVLDIKKEVYRFADRIIVAFADCYGVQGQANIATVRQLQTMGILKPEAAEDLIVMLGIATELRLRGYAYNDGQRDTLAVTKLVSQGIKVTDELLAKELGSVYRINDFRLLYRYYYTALALQDCLRTGEKFNILDVKAIFNEEHLNKKDDHFAIANIYTIFLQYEKAKDEYLKDIEYRYIQGDNAELAASLSNAGNMLKIMGKYEEALPYLRLSLEMMRRLYKEDHIDIAKSLNNFSNVLHDLGYYKEALKNKKESLGVIRRLYKGDNTDIAKALSNLGITLHDLGYYEEALVYKLEGLKMMERIYCKTDHADIARFLDNIGITLRSLKSLNEAKDYHERSEKMMMRIYDGGDHADIARCLHNMGNILNSLGKHEEALLKHTISLEIMKRIYNGGDHADIARCLHDMGNTFYFLSRYEEALSTYKNSLEMMYRIYGIIDHVDISNLLHDNGSVLHFLGEYEEALEKHKKSFDMRCRIYKGDHPYIAQSLDNISIVLQSLKRDKESNEYYNKSLEMSNRINTATLSKQKEFLSIITETSDLWVDRISPKAEIKSESLGK
jgi:tetratricopeptide (TPR) repeat protein